MNRALGIIITGGRKNSMQELVAKRSVAAIPVAGKFRAIDFVLSNMVNSGIDKVGVITQFSYRSLMDHLGSGKEWDLDRRFNGLFVFPPSLSSDDTGWYRGSAEGLYNNLSFLNRSKEEFVIVATGNCIYKMDFNQLIDAHIAQDADITIMYRDMNDIDPEELKDYGILELNDSGRIIDFREKPLTPKGTLASTGVYIISRALLIDLLEESQSQGLYDLVKDIIIRKLDTLKIMSYPFKGYWRALNSISMFYQCNMEMIDPNIKTELAGIGGRVYTKVKDAPPTKYNDEAEVKDCVIADGCIIEGEVYHSVLSRGVKIGQGCVIRNSIIMQDTIVEPGVHLDGVVLDKEVTVTEGKSLKGEPRYPLIVAKGITI